MSFTYKDVIYLINDKLICCEYRARFHSLTEIRYQVLVFEATQESSTYIKGRRIVDSSWKKSPKEAREGVQYKVTDLKPENIIHEEKFSISIPIIDEEL